MPEKFTIEQNEQTVIESFTATNIAELCRRHGVSVAQFHRWKERFLEGARKGLGESSKGNEYQKEIKDLKRLAGYRTLAIAALKKVYLYSFAVISLRHCFSWYPLTKFGMGFYQYYSQHLLSSYFN
ncbi:Transposase [Thermoplasmatales archaeon]|nr:Transposase [Thermoplasmatales archaeon]